MHHDIRYYRNENNLQWLLSQPQESEDEVDNCAASQSDEPKPENNEELLAVHVLGQDAHNINILDVAGRSILVEIAFCHPKEIKSIFKKFSIIF